MRMLIRILTFTLAIRGLLAIDGQTSVAFDTMNFGLDDMVSMFTPRFQISQIADSELEHNHLSQSVEAAPQQVIAVITPKQTQRYSLAMWIFIAIGLCVASVGIIGLVVMVCKTCSENK